MTRASTELRSQSGNSLSLGHLFGTALVVACLSCATDYSWSVGFIGLIWPSKALLIGVLLCRPRRQWPAYLAVAFLVDVTVNLLCPPTYPLPGALYLSACGVLEITGAAWLLQPAFEQQQELTQVRQLLRFSAYGLTLVPAADALFAACYLSGHMAVSYLHAFFYWYLSDALGIAIVTPFYLSLRSKSAFSHRGRYEAAGLILGFSALSCVVFWQTSLPILFLLGPFLLLVELRLSLAGSALALLSLSLIGGYFTAHGHGPMVMTTLKTLHARTVMMQGYVFACMLTLYIVEVVLAEKSFVEANLRASEARFRILAEVSHDMILLQDLDKKRIYVSPASRTFLGLEPEEIIDQNRKERLHPDDLPRVDAMYAQCLAGQEVNILDYRAKVSDGSYIWVQGNLVLYRGPKSGEPLGYVNIVRDISSQKAAEEELNLALDAAKDMARKDALTGVANRRSFDEYLESEWLRAIRESTSVALLMMDVDCFKEYNDRYGHVSGDSCLKAVAQAIASCIRRPADLLARYGGEEFAVVLPNTDPSGVQTIAEQIRSAVEEMQLLHEGNPHGVATISVGCAFLVPQRGALSSDLLVAADRALYDAKSSGRNCARSSTP